MSEPIRLSVDIKLREKSVIALIILLLLPNTFYWAGFSYGSGDFTGAFDNVIAYLTQSTELIYAVQLFATLALVPLIYLLRQNMPWLRSEIGKFTTNFKNSGRSFKTICAYLAAILLGIFVVFSLYTNIKALIDFNGNFYPRGFYPEIALALVAYILDVLLTTAFLGIVLVYIFNHFDLISNAVKELNSVLRDFRLSTYVTRQISGFLYWLYYVVVVGVFALIAPFQTFIEFEQTRQGLDSGFQPQLLLILVGGPLLTLVVGYFVILILRLVFELLIALVHIAQNTASARR